MVNDWNSFTGGQEANDRTQARIDAWKANKKARAQAHLIRLLGILGALACFAYAWSIYPY